MREAYLNSQLCATARDALQNRGTISLKLGLGIQRPPGGGRDGMAGFDQTGADMTVLTTDRLILSPVQVGDYSDLCALFGDPAFTHHIFGRGLDAEEVWFRTLRDIGHWQVLGHGNWAARLKDGGDLVGTFGVLDYRRALDPPFDAPELGWGAAPRFQGQGLALEALTAALAWVDEALNAPRTVCMISADNAPSMKLAARVGYRPYAEGAYKGGTVQLLERHAP